jgi:threonine synthase
MCPDKILFASTNLSSPDVSFREALLRGIAPDGGLYIPSHFPVLRSDLISTFSKLSYHEIATEVLSPYLSHEIAEESLAALTKDAYNFDLPLEDAGNGIWIMRLDRGPTASFKDYAARMMARLMQFYSAGKEKRLVILVATSGDTGSAIASAYHGLPGVEVVILFPVSEVSENQRRQMTTLGGNISVLAVNGKFDDCQRLVKEAFADSALAGVQFSSANSINIGRLLPQAVYYFYAWSRIASSIDEHITFAVPSGNFGNLMGGLIAKRMGLPVKRFVVATNSNDEFPRYLATGRYNPINPSINCISNAMNVGHPSNLARIISLYGGTMDERGVVGGEPDLEAMRNDICSFSVSDSDTVETISYYSRTMGIVIEPHGAVALKAVQMYRESQLKPGGERVVALETAHPAKFPEVITRSTGIIPDSPESLRGLDRKTEIMVKMENRYESFREYLLDTFGNRKEL